MAASHQTGVQRGSRLAGKTTCLSFPIDFSFHASGTNYKLVSFKVTTQKPLLFRTTVVVATPDNSSVSSTVSIGTASGGAQWHSAFNLKGAANTSQNNALGGAGQWIVYKPGDTNVSATGVLEIWMAVTRSGTPSAGRAYFNIEAVELNTKKQSSGSAAL